jgi:hypothetical protein
VSAGLQPISPTAILGTLATPLVSSLLFPDPAMTRGSPLGAFAAAIAVSVAVSLALTPRRSTFELHTLEENVQYIED